MSNRAPQRILAMLASLPLLAAALIAAYVVCWGTLWVGETPDPYVPDGDPCCGHPDTWGQVAGGAAFTLVLALVAGLFAMGLTMAVGYAVLGRWPRWGRLLAVPAAALAVTAAVDVALVVPNLGHARARIDCRRFAFDREAWRASGTRHADQVRALDRCGTLAGATPARVHGLLGTPIHAGPALQGRWWGYDGLEVEFEAGHAVAVRVA